MSDVIAGFGGLAWVLVFFVIAISIIVAVHEYGHYIVGRWSGIYAEVFCIGLGPVIYARRGQARYHLANLCAAAWGVCEIQRRRRYCQYPHGAAAGRVRYRVAAHHARRTTVGAGGDGGGGSCVQLYVQHCPVHRAVYGARAVFGPP